MAIHTPRPPPYDWIETGNIQAHTQNGGRMWHQQPQTIKGVKVLPFLNCSSLHKMGTKTPALPSPGQKEENNREKRSWGLEPQLTVNKCSPLMQNLFFPDRKKVLKHSVMVKTVMTVKAYWQQIWLVKKKKKSVIRFHYIKQSHFVIVQLISQPVLFSKSFVTS